MYLNLIQTHLNYNPLIQRGKNGSEDMTKMMKSKYKAMQAFGLRGDLGKHREIQQHLSLTLKMPLNLNSNGVKLGWSKRSPHGF